jgi:hypothetical protein
VTAPQRPIVHGHFYQPGRAVDSDGWFREDPACSETAQILRAAARAVRIVDGLAGSHLERRLVDDLSVLASPSRRLDGAALYRQALADVSQPPPM